jgi:transposase
MSDPREPELLRQIAERDAEIAARDAALAQARQEISLLRQKLDALARRLFGKKSEQLSPDQLQLLFQELVAPGPAEGKESGPETAQAPAPLPKNKAPQAPRQRKPRLPEHLPVLEEIIEPEPVKADPQLWRKIDEERSELLEYEPARFFRRVLVRPKYVRRDDPDAPPLIAPMPPRFLDRSFATASLVAQIVVGKYVDHLPLYRQERIFASRHGVELSRQTMAEWIGVAADWLKPVYLKIKAQVLESGMKGGYVQIDETPIRYLLPGNGEAKLGYLWACHRPGADAVFFWKTSRAAACLEEIVPQTFGGIIQCDGYAGYDAFQRMRNGSSAGGPIELAGCFAHVRRKFVEALLNAPRHAGLVLHLMQNLYRTEAKLRECRAGPKLRQIRREAESGPAIERLRRTLAHWKGSGRFLPKSAMGKAVEYALGQWESLLVHLRDGRVEIDTNLVENAIRPTAVGKKNWLFIGHSDAGERGAVLYTIVESCRRRGIDPYEYLRDVLTRLPSATNWQVKDLTPAAWSEAKRRQQLKAAA